MRLSDAGARCRQTKLIYPNHRLPPWLTEDAPRDRSNRLLGAGTMLGTGQFGCNEIATCTRLDCASTLGAEIDRAGTRCDSSGS